MRRKPAACRASIVVMLASPRYTVASRIGTTGPWPATASITRWCALAVAASQSRSSRLRRSAASPYSARSTSPATAVSPPAATARTALPPTPASPASAAASTGPATAYSQTPADSVTAPPAPLRPGGRVPARLQFPHPVPEPAVFLRQVVKLGARPAAVAQLAGAVAAPGDLSAPVRGARAQPRVAFPPVDAHLPGRVERGDHQAQLDRQQLDVEQVDPDVARDHQALVEHSLQDVTETGGLAAAEAAALPGSRPETGQVCCGHLTLPHRRRRGRARTSWSSGTTSARRCRRSPPRRWRGCRWRRGCGDPRRPRCRSPSRPRYAPLR